MTPKCVAANHQEKTRKQIQHLDYWGENCRGRIKQYEEDIMHSHIFRFNEMLIFYPASFHLFRAFHPSKIFQFSATYESFCFLYAISIPCLLPPTTQPQILGSNFMVDIYLLCVFYPESFYFSICLTKHKHFQQFVYRCIYHVMYTSMTLPLYVPSPLHFILDAPRKHEMKRIKTFCSQIPMFNVIAIL